MKVTVTIIAAPLRRSHLLTMSLRIVPVRRSHRPSPRSPAYLFSDLPFFFPCSPCSLQLHVTGITRNVLQASDIMKAKRVLVAKRPAVQALEPKRSECSYSRSEDSLLFDCRGCARGKDLNDSVCLKRVISVARRTDRCEGGRSLRRLGVALSGGLRPGSERLRRTGPGLPVQQPECVPDGEQCQMCPDDPRKLVAAIAERAPMPWDDLRRRAAAVNVRPGCYACVASTASVMADWRHWPRASTGPWPKRRSASWGCRSDAPDHSRDIRPSSRTKCPGACASCLTGTE